HGFEPRNVDRLGQVVRGAAAERLDRRIDGGVAGDQDDLGGAILDLGQELQTAAVRQLQIDQRQVRRVLAQVRASLAQAAGALDREPLRPYQLGRGPAGITTGVLELRCYTVVEAKKHGATGVSLGVAKGLGMIVSRALVEAYEVVSAPFPVPPCYRPPIQPEFPWSYFEQAPRSARSERRAPAPRG